jgi:hypothetical protein
MANSRALGLGPSSFRNLQTLPLVTQPKTAGVAFCSRSLKSRIATISATH